MRFLNIKQQDTLVNYMQQSKGELRKEKTIARPSKNDKLNVLLVQLKQWKKSKTGNLCIILIAAFSYKTYLY